MSFLQKRKQKKIELVVRPDCYLSVDTVVEFATLCFLQVVKEPVGTITTLINVCLRLL